MAKNTKEGYRKGPIKNRTQVYNPKTKRWVKVGPDKKFMDCKADNEPFKNVTKVK